MLARILTVICISTMGLAQTATTADNKAPAAATANAPANAATDALVSARALLDKGKYGEASAAFKALVEKEPKSPEAQTGLIRSLYRDDQFDEAEAAAKNAIATLPQSALVQATVGDLAFRLGKFADAETAYRTSLKLDADSARGLFGMGRMFEMVSMHKMAKNALAKAHERAPDDKEIYNRWLETLPYAEQLDAVKKAAGDHPTEREKRHIAYLAAAVQKKPWSLISPIKPTEIKMEPYGRTEAFVDKGSRVGMTPISTGYGLQVKFNDRAAAVLLLDTGADGIIIGRKLGEKAGVVKIADSYVGGIGDQGAVEVYFGWVDKINIGGIEFRNCVVEVSSKTDIADEAGLIGPDVFEKFLVTLDFKNWKLQLAPLPRNPNASADDDEPQDRYIAPEMQSFTKIWRFGHDLVIPVVVSDKAMGNFILDTGAGMNSVTPKIAQQITKLSYEGYSVKGVSGKVKEVLNGDKAILQFARVRVRSDDIPVFEITNISNSEGTEISGFIGIKTLVQMKFTIDYRDGLVNLETYQFKPARE
ncbi:MAG TPA: aspartyl protease family protein [Candidatus Angelobacter sp.]|nr:aspartyl protease family protein [Candidatus Angelobacter sp.]